MISGTAAGGGISDGEFYPFREAEDGYDTQEWVGLQPWCNGRLGTVGASYLGIVQWTAAPLRSSHLACMSPRVMGPDFHGSIAYPGGAFQLGVMLTWGMRTNARTAQSIDYHNWTEGVSTRCRSLPSTRWRAVTSGSGRTG